MFWTGESSTTRWLDSRVQVLESRPKKRMLAWWSNYKANGFSHYSLSVFAYFRSCASLTNMAEEATTQHNSKPPSSSLGTNPITLTHAIALIQPSKLPCIYFLPDEMKAWKLRIYFLALKSKHSVWKSQKKSYSTLYCVQSEVCLHFKWKKLSILSSFWKPEACGQKVLPDMSILIGQKFKNSNSTFLVIFI